MHPNNFILLFEATQDLFRKELRDPMAVHLNVDMTAPAETRRVYCNEEPIEPARGMFTFTCFDILGSKTQITFPFFELWREPKQGYDHTLYWHQFANCASYIGITKNSWFHRFNQHIQSAKRVSRLLFHSAIREHQKEFVTHTVVLAGVPKDVALAEEERFVEKYSLYPKGLNMVPGGESCLRYLGRLGFSPKTIEERDNIIERISLMELLSGRPNPLCAARWASDQEYINAVICGRADRFTVDQVRIARLHSSFGKSDQEIAALLSAPIERVSRVISGKRYGRVR